MASCHRTRCSWRSEVDRSSSCSPAEASRSQARCCTTTEVHPDTSKTNEGHQGTRIGYHSHRTKTMRGDHRDTTTVGRLDMTIEVRRDTRTGLERDHLDSTTLQADGT